MSKVAARNSQWAAVCPPLPSAHHIRVSEADWPAPAEISLPSPCPSGPVPPRHIASFIPSTLYSGPTLENSLHLQSEVPYKPGLPNLEVRAFLMGTLASSVHIFCLYAGQGMLLASSGQRPGSCSAGKINPPQQRRQGCRVPNGLWFLERNETYWVHRH